MEEVTQDRIIELSKEIEKLEYKLDILKNERMALMAVSSAQLLKFEYAQFKKYYRGSDDFRKYVIQKCPRPKSYGLFDCWDSSREMFLKITRTSILEVTKNRTDIFDDMNYDEKIQLRSVVDKKIKTFYKDFLKMSYKAKMENRRK